MKNKRWTTSRTSVFNIGYHFIWCPKYRRKVLVDDIAKELRTQLSIKAKEIKVEIMTLNIMPDHVHAFIKCSPVDAPHWVIGQLKGFTSKILRKKFPSLKSRLPSLWTRSYYCESVGHISESTIKKYIDEQKGK